MKKTTKNARSSSKATKAEDRTITTSIAFKPDTLRSLKDHPICTKGKGDRSVSYVVNRLVDKFLAGDTELD